MSYFLLFCTANIPSKIIDELIYTPPNTVRQWILVKDKSQPIPKISTEAPIQDFTTGFLGASLDELGAFLGEVMKKEDKFTNLSEKTFGVLDERSKSDKTVQVVTWWYRDSLQQRKLQDPDDHAGPEEWIPLRQPFFAAASLVSCIDFATFELLDEHRWMAEGLTEEGFLVLPDLKKEYENRGYRFKTK